MNCSTLISNSPLFPSAVNALLSFTEARSDEMNRLRTCCVEAELPKAAFKKRAHPRTKKDTEPHGGSRSLTALRQDGTVYPSPAWN